MKLKKFHKLKTVYNFLFVFVFSSIKFHLIYNEKKIVLLELNNPIKLRAELAFWNQELMCLNKKESCIIL